VKPGVQGKGKRKQKRGMEKREIRDAEGYGEKVHFIVS